MDDLKVKWSKKENDLLYYSPRKSDGGVLYYFFEYLTSNATCDGKTRTLRDELIARGFDITTLKFSIKKKETK